MKVYDFGKGSDVLITVIMMKKKVIMFCLTALLCSCGGGNANTRGNSSSAVVDLSASTVSMQSSQSNFSAPVQKPRTSKKQRRKRKKARSVVGSWKTSNGNFQMQFQKGGQGVAIRDKKYQGHLYTYYRDFLWKQKNGKVLVKYTSETSIRDGVHIVREKTLSETASFQISGNQLLRKKGKALYRE